MTLGKLVTFLSSGSLTVKYVIWIWRRPNKKVHVKVLVIVKSYTNIDNKGNSNSCPSDFFKLALLGKIWIVSGTKWRKMLLGVIFKKDSEPNKEGASWS